ncbi:MAG: hypothetical protein A2860_03950 [Candidatus Levybacteria bacterium RIFCSPHIGHO2_01_FULL_37_33]|nr:MAG: hypothetical protein A2860_03950 [Candidatus Levybacteria bacterium RIFCSPHIGHO2_01_FULL_37_33]OGH33047.1 MAG: hypothetical protein A2953_00045 [Candidatus Levybacteria bacterium RIFCSPLOWO2_01_FULL_36_54]
MRNVFVSIINFNGRENTLACLDSIKKTNISDFKLNIVVIDNGSKEKLNLTQDYLGSIPLKIIVKEKNLGFTGGHNVGINYALSKNADYVLVLNNDVIVDPNLISQLIKTLDKNSRYAVASPKIYFAPGFEYHKDGYKQSEKGNVIWYAGGQMDWENVIARHRGVDEVDKGQYQQMEETDFATGACFLINREMLERVGFFDDKYFLYYEDSDLSQRIRRAGYKIIYAPDAVLWHRNAAAAGGSGSPLQDYYISRNRLLFGLRYASLRSKTALIKESIRLLVIGREWQKKGIRDFYLRRFGRGSYSV